MMKYTLFFFILCIFWGCKPKSEELIVSKTNSSLSNGSGLNLMINNNQKKQEYKDSKQWQGKYAGTLPCPDCDGIEISISLSPKKKYELQMTRLNTSEPKVTEKGNFVWLDSNNILLDNEQQMEFMVSEDRLWLLKSSEIQEIKLGSNTQYILEKK